MEKKVMPTTWFLGFLALIILMNFLFGEKRMIPFPYNHLGWVLIVFGIAFNLWTDNLFKKYKTTVKPYLRPSFFISNGPFRISRNPMYLGMLIILIGTVILFKSVALMVIPAIYLFIINFFYIKKEEEFLLHEFGDEYLKYKKRVRSWI